MTPVADPVNDRLRPDRGQNRIEKLRQSAPANLPTAGHGNLVQAEGALDIIVARLKDDAAAFGDKLFGRLPYTVQASQAAVDFVGKGCARGVALGYFDDPVLGL